MNHFLTGHPNHQTARTIVASGGEYLSSPGRNPRRACNLALLSSASSVPSCAPAPYLSARTHHYASHPCAPRALLTVPIVGAFLIDFANALLATSALNFFR